jgi:stage II sporulation protein AB (anti-sigma F factor)
MSVRNTTLNESYPALASTVPVARRALTEFAADAGVSPARLEEIRLATSEALTNAVVHAYREEPGTIYVTAAVVADELWMLISDDGCGLRARANRPGLGLGLALIAQASDDFMIVPRAAGGTEVRMRFDLRPAGDRGCAGARGLRRQLRGSFASADRPASSRFSPPT